MTLQTSPDQAGSPAQSSSPRKIGVEEELLLVDPASGELTAVSSRAVAAHEQGETLPSVGVTRDDVPEVEQELFLQQIETATAPVMTLDDLHAELVRSRRAVGEAARAAGAGAVAVPTPVLVDPQEHVTPKPRYQHIYDEYGEMARQSLVCGMHVHVDIADDEEGVAVIDRIRPWLPVLLALSANSPYWRGRETGYASWRSQIWGRWPSGGPAEPFSDLATYRETSDRIVAWGAAIDQASVYFDARLAQDYPTVEIRVADVCTDPEDAALVAGLARALVETEARSWRAGEPPAAWRADLLRAATWRAARYGVAGKLVHPERFELASARDVVAGLLDHVGEVLEEYGDRAWVGDAFEKQTARGTGAARQRAVLESTGSMADVVKDLLARTEASWSR